MSVGSTMKKRLYTYIITGALLLSSGVGLQQVAAQANSSAANTNTANTGQSTTGNQNQAATTQQPADPAVQGLADRIKQRKDANKTVVTIAQQNRLKQRCKAAQTAFEPISQKLILAQAAWTEKYTKLSDSVVRVSGKLDSGKIDTVNLKLVSDKLQAKSQDFKAQSETLAQAMNDLKAIDCAGDPVGFKVTLEAVRAGVSGLRTASSEIKQLVANELKPELDKISSQIGVQNGGDQ